MSWKHQKTIQYLYLQLDCARAAQLKAEAFVKFAEENDLMLYGEWM